MGKFPLLVRVTLCGRVSEVALVNPSWTFSLSAIRLETDLESKFAVGLLAGMIPEARVSWD